MRTNFIRPFFLAFSMVFLFSSWGFFGHETIHEKAVYSLPKEMWPLYKEHISILIEKSTNPDKRRHFSKKEPPKHYIDLDAFGMDPKLVFPANWDSAKSFLTEDTLWAYGVLPWNIEWVYYDLVEAFDSNDGNAILRLSADLGHYISDACVPLHTTVNYNGQLTNQRGIHGFWESRLPELFAEEYFLYPGKAEYIHDRQGYIWEIIFESFSAKDSVLELDREIQEEFAETGSQAIEERKGQGIRTQSREASNAYHEALNGMVERRMRRSIKAVADFWFTAWVDAGQPNLKKIGIEEEKETKFFGEKVLEKLWGN